MKRIESERQRCQLSNGFDSRQSGPAPSGPTHWQHINSSNSSNSSNNINNINNNSSNNRRECCKNRIKPAEKKTMGLSLSIWADDKKWMATFTDTLRPICRQRASDGVRWRQMASGRAGNRITTTTMMMTTTTMMMTMMMMTMIMMMRRMKKKVRKKKTWPDNSI